MAKTPAAGKGGKGGRGKSDKKSQTKSSKVRKKSIHTVPVPPPVSAASFLLLFSNGASQDQSRGDLFSLTSS